MGNIFPSECCEKNQDQTSKVVANCSDSMSVCGGGARSRLCLAAHPGVTTAGRKTEEECDSALTSISQSSRKGSEGLTACLLVLLGVGRSNAWADKSRFCNHCTQLNLN